MYDATALYREERDESWVVCFSQNELCIAAFEPLLQGFASLCVHWIFFFDHLLWHA